MSYGLKIRNDFGTTLITSAYANPVLRAAGTVSVRSDGLIIIPYAGDTSSIPVCAIRGGNHRRHLTISGGSGNGWNWSFQYKSSSPPGTVVQYWVFDTYNPVNPSGQYGIRVRGAGTQEQFTSLNKPLRILDVLAGNGGPGSYSNHSGRTKAIVHGRRCFTYQEQTVSEGGNVGETGQTSWDTFPLEALTTPNGFDFAFDFSDRINQTLTPSEGITMYSFLMVDVTHY